jgi:hypothetical protein
LLIFRRNIGHFFRLKYFKIRSKTAFSFPFPRSANEGDDDRHLWYPGEPNRGPQPNLYPHNTYHGPSPHYRTPLNPADFKPLRFTDSPQHPFGLKTSPGVGFRNSRKRFRTIFFLGITKLTTKICINGICNLEFNSTKIYRDQYTSIYLLPLINYLG